MADFGSIVKNGIAYNLIYKDNVQYTMIYLGGNRWWTYGTSDDTITTKPIKGYLRRIMLGDTITSKDVYFKNQSLGSMFEEYYPSTGYLIECNLSGGGGGVFYSSANDDATTYSLYYDNASDSPTLIYEYKDGVETVHTEQIFMPSKIDGTVENLLDLTDGTEDIGAYHCLFIRDEKVRPLQVGDIITNKTKLYFNLSDWDLPNDLASINLTAIQTEDQSTTLTLSEGIPGNNVQLGGEAGLLLTEGSTEIQLAKFYTMMMMQYNPDFSSYQFNLTKDYKVTSVTCANGMTGEPVMLVDETTLANPYKRRIVTGDTLNGAILYSNYSFSDVELLPSIATALVESTDGQSVIIAMPRGIALLPFGNTSTLDYVIYEYDANTDTIVQNKKALQIPNDGIFNVKTISDDALYRKLYIDDENIRPFKVGDLLMNNTQIYSNMPDDLSDIEILGRDLFNNSWYLTYSPESYGSIRVYVTTIDGVDYYSIGQDIYYTDDFNVSSFDAASLNHLGGGITEPTKITSINPAHPFFKYFLVDVNTLAISDCEKRRVMVGDNLKNRYIYTDFNDDYINYFNTYKDDVKYITFKNDSGFIHSYFDTGGGFDALRVWTEGEIYFTGNKYHLYWADKEGGTNNLAQNNATLQMPNESSPTDYIVTSIVDTNPSYKHTFVRDTKLRHLQIGDVLTENTKIYFNFPDDIGYTINWESWSNGSGKFTEDAAVWITQGTGITDKIGFVPVQDDMGDCLSKIILTKPMFDGLPLKTLYTYYGDAVYDESKLYLGLQSNLSYLDETSGTESISGVSWSIAGTVTEINVNHPFYKYIVVDETTLDSYVEYIATSWDGGDTRAEFYANMSTTKEHLREHKWCIFKDNIALTDWLFWVDPDGSEEAYYLSDNNFNGAIRLQPKSLAMQFIYFGSTDTSAYKLCYMHKNN